MLRLDSSSRNWEKWEKVRLLEEGLKINRGRILELEEVRIEVIIVYVINLFFC